MSKESLEKLNEKLIQHFKETGVENAYYYEPVDDAYWNKTSTSKRVAFCNLEPYRKNKDEDIKGYCKLNKETLYDSWFYTQTPSRIVAMNFWLSKALYDGKYDISESDIKDSVARKNEEELWIDFDNSLYFNFRYTCSKTVSADTEFLLNMYKDPFYCQQYRDFVDAAEIDILIVGGELGCGLINKIYPDLHLTYKGKPVKYNERLFVSMEHPSRIAYADMIETIYDIVEAVYKK